MTYVQIYVGLLPPIDLCSCLSVSFKNYSFRHVMLVHITLILIPWGALLLTLHDVNVILSATLSSVIANVT